MDSSIIDVREYPEYAAGHIEGSRLVPLESLKEASSAWDRADGLTLVCKTGRRAEQARQQLAADGFTHLSIVEGGVDAWRAAGKPLISDEHRPWSLERQVRITAGSLVFVGTLLGYFVSPWFLAGSGFIGAGLVFAGVSDTCLMGSILSQAPWNRPARLGA
jgi:rhodanese-related sulfurtransferase